MLFSFISTYKILTVWSVFHETDCCLLLKLCFRFGVKVYKLSVCVQQPVNILNKPTTGIHCYMTITGVPPHDFLLSNIHNIRYQHRDIQLANCLSHEIPHVYCLTVSYILPPQKSTAFLIHMLPTWLYYLHDRHGKGCVMSIEVLSVIHWHKIL
jgi:hypothetical protein